MAKVKSAGLRNYVGKLGGNVYYMNKGQNVARELSPEVSNPRTPAQMRQRMKWANIVNVYKANRGWMGHLSFENKPQTQSDYNAFMSANIGQNPVYLTKQAVENGDCVLAPYTMTKGSLPTIGYDWAASVGGVETDIKITIALSGATIGDLAADIIANNPEWQYGDQLSIVLMYRGVSPYPVVVPIEIVLDTNDTTPLSEVETPYATLNEMLLVGDNNELDIDCSQGVTYSKISVCVIHSRTISGRTSVSTQAFELSTTAALEFVQMGTDEQFNYAAASYGLGADYFLAAGYQEQQGGGGGSSLVRSFTGKYQADSSGDDTNFTITDGGQNTFKAAASDAITNTTRCVLVARTEFEDTDYVLYFTPTGGSNINVGLTAQPVGGATLSFACSRTNALNIENKAGKYELIASDEYDPALVVAEWNVEQ